MSSLRLGLIAAAIGGAAPIFAVPSAALAREQRSITGASANDAGTPTVVLDRLVFPDSFPDRGRHLRALKRTLRREARRADWGAGRGSRIEYRFTVTELALQHSGSVLHVRCTAYGKLPKGKTAKSHLVYGGDPRQRRVVVDRVLEIVARGVITRLAELERVRRGQLERAQVRAPVSD